MGLGVLRTCPNYFFKGDSIMNSRFRMAWMSAGVLITGHCTVAIFDRINTNSFPRMPLFPTQTDHLQRFVLGF
jgi:hypothetical protein